MTHPLFTRDSQQRDLTTREFSMRGDSINKDARSISSLISTETPAQVMDWTRWEIIDEVLLARGVEAADSVPVLANHLRYSLDTVLGRAVNVKTTGKGVEADLFFVKGDAEVDKVWNKIEQRALDSVSVGYRALDYIDIPPGGSQKIGDKVFNGGTRGLRVTKRWALKEVSVVPIGADQFAKMRNEAGIPPQITGKVNAMKLTPQMLAYLRSLGLRKDAPEAEALAFMAKLTDEQRSYCEGLGETPEQPEQQRSVPETPAPAPAAAPAPAPVVDIESARAEGMRLEQDRQDSIREMAGNEIPAELVNEAIKKRLSVEGARKMFYEHLLSGRQAPVGSAPGIIVRNGEASAQVLAAGLMHRCGFGDRIIDAKATGETRRQQEALAEMGSRFRNLPSLELARRAIQLDGRTVPHDPIDIVRTALSGGTLGSIFTDSVNASLMMGYEQAPDTTAGWVQEKDVNDFKVNTAIGFQTTSGMAPLGAGGKARHLKMDDNAETFRVVRYAEQSLFDEQNIINDQLDALTEVPLEHGKNAANLRPDGVFALLRANPTLASDSTALFHSDHSNLLDSAYSSPNLKTGATAMQKQKLNGVNLNIQPAYIVASLDLKFSILQDLQSSMIVATGSTDATKGNANTLQNLVEPRFDARLSNTVVDPLTGTSYAGSATAWYLVAPPGTSRGIIVAYRRGTNRRPQLTSWVSNGQEGFWGMGFAINMDIGFGVNGYRGLYRGNV